MDYCCAASLPLRPGVDGVMMYKDEGLVETIILLEVRYNKTTIVISVVKRDTVYAEVKGQPQSLTLFHYFCYTVYSYPSYLQLYKELLNHL